MNRFVPFVAAAVTGLSLLASATAGPTWSLEWQTGSNALVSDSGRSLLQFTPNNTTSSASTATPTVSYLDVSTSASAAHPDSFTHQFYLAVLRLTDLASGQSGLFTFVGDLTGTVSVSSANLVNQMLSQDSYTSIHLGKNTYDLSFGPFTGPDMVLKVPGLLDAQVSVQPSGSDNQPGSGRVNQSPEPTTAVLALLGSLGVGTWAWGRRQKPSWS
jgi:hypothetical protein